MKGKCLMLLPKTVDGYWTTIGAQQSLGESEGVSCHTFSLPEDQYMCLLLENLRKRMPKA
jgi:hypothetical protein